MALITSKIRICCGILFLIGCFIVGSAKEYKDTIRSTDDDRIIITYDLKYSNDEIKIDFISAKKKLSLRNERRYEELENVEVVFFDRTGVYRDTKFTNLTPEAFMVPYGLKYKASDLGYFCFHQEPSISFKVTERGDKVLSIPIYLAYYEGKGKYKLFSCCKKFNISIKNSNIKKIAQPKGNDSEMEMVSTEIELDADNELAIQVMSSVNSIKDYLPNQTELPFGTVLQGEINTLLDLQKKVSDEELIGVIKKTLKECELKEQELKAASAAAAQQAQDDAKKEMERQQKEQQAREDSIAAVQQQQAEAEKKRNIWMIIGGIILAILGFIGNQVLQHFRNIRSQRSMMEMQQDIVTRAENEAKRHAQNYTRNKTNQMVNSTRRKANDMVRNKTKQIGNKKSNNFSI